MSYKENPVSANYDIPPTPFLPLPFPFLPPMAAIAAYAAPSPAPPEPPPPTIFTQNGRAYEPSIGPAKAAWPAAAAAPATPAESLCFKPPLEPTIDEIKPPTDAPTF